MMKMFLFLSIMAMMCQSSFAQSRHKNEESSIKTIELDGVTIRPIKYKQHSNKVKLQHVFINFNKHDYDNIAGENDSTYFLTMYPKLENYPVELKSVELTIEPFDTSAFDLRLAVYQVINSDTSFVAIDVDNIHLIKHKHLTLELQKEGITLLPNEFYIGYGFHSKKIPTQFSYRLYSSTKGGKGAIMKISYKGISMVSNENIPYIFPFKISYTRHL